MSRFASCENFFVYKSKQYYFKQTKISILKLERETERRKRRKGKERERHINKY